MVERGKAPTMGSLGDRLGEVLAERYLYHFMVRRYARRVLGEPEEWDGLPVRSPLSDLRQPGGR